MPYIKTLKKVKLKVLAIGISRNSQSSQKIKNCIDLKQ